MMPEPPMPEYFPTEGVRAMSKEEILACGDTRLLAEREEFFSERCIVIATMLEFPRFPDSDKVVTPDWYRRARTALIHFRICRARIEKRIKDLNREKSSQQGRQRLQEVPAQSMDLLRQIVALKPEAPQVTE